MAGLKRKQTWIVVGLLVACVLLLAGLCLPSASAWYHRAELVHLGGLSETTYVLRHLKTSTPEGLHFVRKWISRNCPPMHDCSSPHRPGEPMEMTVWCDAEYVDDWRRFIEEHDVSDYGTRYLDSK